MQQTGTERASGNGHRAEELARIPKASMQFHIESERIPWVFACLMNAPEVVLYKGEFPEPFQGLAYVAGFTEDQLVLQAHLPVGDEFNQRYGKTLQRTGGG
jgi:hypothetical protein